MTEVMKTATTVANVCVRASLATGGPGEGERESLGGGGGWDGENCLDVLWEKGEKRSRYCMLVCVFFSTVFFFLFFFFFDLLQQFFLTFRPDCGFIL